jgi:hypothetical protein
MLSVMADKAARGELRGTGRGQPGQLRANIHFRRMRVTGILRLVLPI